MTSNISVAMACCNGENYIVAQLESILNQTEKPDEIIVSDDASTDNTIQILLAYANNKLIKLHRNERRIGIIGNFKHAVSLCKSDNYIALCDQDDHWLPDKLKENIAAIKSVEDGTRPAIAFSDLSVVDEHMSVINKSFWSVLNISPGDERLRSLLFGNFITGCTILMNKEMRRHFSSMPVEGVSMHDAWLGLIAFTFGRYTFINKPLVLYRQHGRNVTYETNQRNGLVDKINQALKQVLNNDQYLINEITMAKTFSDVYETYLSPADKEVLLGFIALEKASFIKKKMSSIIARAYRISKKF